MGKAGCMCLGVFLLAMWGCCRASTGCLWSGKAVARVNSRKGRLAGIDLLVVPVFEASAGCVDAATLITAWSALIAVSNGCCHSPYCEGDAVVGAVASCVSSFGDAVGEVGVEVCVSGEVYALLLLRLLVGLRGTNVSFNLFGAGILSPGLAEERPQFLMSVAMQAMATEQMHISRMSRNMRNRLRKTEW